MALYVNQDGLQKILEFGCVERTSLAKFAGTAFVDSVMDAFRLVRLVSEKEKCERSCKIEDLFCLQFSNSFRCRCQEETLSEITKFSFKVRVKDRDDVKKLSFFDIYERNLREKEFKVCKNYNCSYKKSKLTEKLINFSEYIILEIDLKSERFEVNENNISIEKEFRKTGNLSVSVYEIFLISACDKDSRHVLFRRFEDSWLDESLEDFDIQNMLYLLNSSNFQINLIIYKLKTQSSDSSSPVSIVKNGAKIKCDFCRTFNPESNLACIYCNTKLKNLCSMCNTTYELQLKSCPNCEKLKKVSNLLSNPCPSCKSPIINGRTCTKCSQKQTPIKVIHPATEIENQSANSNHKPKCPTCKKHFNPSLTECPSCKIPEEDKPKIPSKQKLCETCQKPKDSNICINCLSKSSTNFYYNTHNYDPANYSSPLPKSSFESQSDLRKSQLSRPESSAKPKRGASANVGKVFCNNCGSGLSPSEQRNCGSCLKTMSSKSDKCSYCYKQIVYICDCCAKSKKKNK